MRTPSTEFLKSAFQEADWPREQLAEIAFLGTMPDKELAARFGHSVGSTKAKRLSLGIAAFER